VDGINIELAELVVDVVGERTGEGFGATTFVVGIVTGALLTLGHDADDGELPNVRPNKSSKLRSFDVRLYVTSQPGMKSPTPKPQVRGIPSLVTTRG
jgi:hypothetical protein